MGEYICFLIIVLDESGIQLLKCALKVKREQLPGDVDEFPMKPENCEHLRKLLPRHVASAGPIVDVQRLFECHVID